MLEFMVANMPGSVKVLGIGVEGRPVNKTIEKDMKKIQESIKFDKDKSKELAKETTDNLLNSDFDVNDGIDIEEKLNNM